MDRIRAARKGTMLFAALYGIFIALLFVIFAGPMARLFSDEKAVIDVLKAYIYITCAGYGMLEVHRYSGFCMTGTHEPLRASFLNNKDRDSACPALAAGRRPVSIERHFLGPPLNRPHRRFHRQLVVG
jgi:hypothetical protein